MIFHGGEKIRSWVFNTEDKGEYVPGNKSLLLDDKLPVGAYILLATGGGETVRELVLVTDASLVCKTTGHKALVYFCDALNGSPIPDATVILWEQYHVTNTFGVSKWRWRHYTAQTDKDGLCLFELTESNRRSNIFVAARSADRQAMSNGYTYDRGRHG